MYNNVLDLRNLVEQVKKVFCFKNCTELSLLEQIDLVISFFFAKSRLQPLNSKVFLDHQNNCFSQQVKAIFTIKKKRILKKIRKNPNLMGEPILPKY